MNQYQLNLDVNFDEKLNNKPKSRVHSLKKNNYYEA